MLAGTEAIKLHGTYVPARGFLRCALCVTTDPIVPRNKGQSASASDFDRVRFRLTCNLLTNMAFVQLFPRNDMRDVGELLGQHFEQVVYGDDAR